MFPCESDMAAHRPQAWGLPEIPVSSLFDVRGLC